MSRSQTETVADPAIGDMELEIAVSPGRSPVSWILTSVCGTLVLQGVSLLTGFATSVLLARLRLPRIDCATWVPWVC